MTPEELRLFESIWTIPQWAWNKMTDVHLWRAYEFDYEENYTIGIYSTHEQAEAAIARRKTEKFSGPSFGIEHFLLDSEEEPAP